MQDTFPIHTDDKPGRTLRMNGRDYLFFSGYAYLGMNHVPAFTDLVKEGIEKYGLSFPSSRISNTRLSLFEAMEQLLSSITNQQATVCMASGFSAGTLANTLLSPAVLAAPGTHPAVYKGVSPLPDESSWQVAVHTAAGKAPTAFVADAVNIFQPGIRDFSFLKGLDSVTALIDDSHGIGITGIDGSGVTGTLPHGPAYIITYSLSKAFNLVGGAISCSQEQASQLRSLPEYTAATSLSPAYVYAFIQGQPLYQQQRKQLLHNMQLFAQMTASIPGILHHPQLPVFVLPDTVSEQLLLERHIIISSFAYPTPESKKIKRVVINALHTEQDLQQLATTLHQLSGS
ncbi:7-keto-8-aminopelargonate synthetase-like enzyme [Filimonas zeae]|uniref:8-amino-7-oxononanoate synthase n=1 Tax=Filimonas zeae TaxID=1737353 RepID=A0A917J3K9_9BACT|nr:aminotransferase class I/II-fold pyridoxal phosphate-dependent enzyme [Filimonas zeae]MDR6341724.1 7-keto-8-aminopelargonate synthetase-like enzyme [Filimonas zeae]GGH74451.1 putative 8-amino-7-oxononanoate synthase [Filimonas zeae]